MYQYSRPVNHFVLVDFDPTRKCMRLRMASIDPRPPNHGFDRRPPNHAAGKAAHSRPCAPYKVHYGRVGLERHACNHICDISRDGGSCPRTHACGRGDSLHGFLPAVLGLKPRSSPRRSNPPKRTGHDMLSPDPPSPNRSPLIRGKRFPIAPQAKI